jgi:hypothetical protein
MPTTFAAGQRIKSAEINGNFSEFLSADLLKNIGLSCSVGSSALTIALKNAAGNDASYTDAVQIGFRSATLTTGTVSLVSVTSALSTVISSGSTAGHSNAVEGKIFVYAINNAGTIELAWSSRYHNENNLVSTTAEGGAGAADSAATLYSTAARSNVACRLIGQLVSTQTTAGTWAAVPTNTRVGGVGKILQNEKIIAAYNHSAGTSINTASTTIVDFANIEFDSRACVTTGASWKFTVPAGCDGIYKIYANVVLNASTGWVDAESLSIDCYKNGAQAKGLDYQMSFGSASNINNMCQGMCYLRLVAGDYIDIRITQNSGAAITLVSSGAYNYVIVQKVGEYTE